MLRPGGLVILIEADSEPIADGKSATELTRSGQPSGMPGWFALWEAYRQCLRDKGVDVNVPPELENLVTTTGAFDKIVSQEGNIPIGFWPKGKWLDTWRWTLTGAHVARRPRRAKHWAAGMDEL